MMFKKVIPAIAAVTALAFWITTSSGIFSAGIAQTDALKKREELYRLNNLGVAFMEQFKHEEAAGKFRQALSSDPDFSIARTNLAMALFYLNDYTGALKEATAAVKLAPDSLHAGYILAASLRYEKRYDESIAEFNKVLAVDPKDPATNIQIGQIYSVKQEYSEAITAFRRALDAEPYNATAAYSLAQALIRSGESDKGREMLAVFQKLRASGYATTLGNVYGEKGRYAEAVVSSGAEPELISTDALNVTYSASAAASGIKSVAPGINTSIGRRITKAEFNDNERNQLVSSFASNMALGDINGDNRPDLVVTGLNATGAPFINILLNNSRNFDDVSKQAGITINKPLSGVLIGDVDNDKGADIFLFGYRTLSLWLNNGDGSFTDVTKKSGLPEAYESWAMTAAWVDADHDGDLDLFTGNFADISKFPEKEIAIFPEDFAGRQNNLFRNNGNGTFTDITTESGLGGGLNKTTAVVATDFNNKRDIDFLVVNYGAPVQLYSNQRDGSFKEVAALTNLVASSHSLSAGAGDLNKDNFTDFYLPNMSGNDLLFLSNGRGSYVKSEVPGNSTSAQFVDYDNDGLLDVITQNGDRLMLRRGLGGKLADPQPAVAPKTAGTRSPVPGDINNDGGADIVTFAEDGSVSTLRVAGFNRNYTRLILTGKTSNHGAVATKVELRSGSLRQKLEIYASSPAPAAVGVVFGLGFRDTVDALQLMWPAGILQSELAVKTSTDNVIEELDRKGTSCPLLYAWNGTEFRFVTDFLGGSAIGYLTSPGQYNYPDTDEYIRVTSDQLKDRNGRLSILMNNQLEEVIYFDRVRLLAVDHPEGTEVYPNERLMPAPPYPDFKVYSVRNPRPPASAVDDRGNDILPLISKIDRRYPENFEKLRFKGYAAEHTIELDLGDIDVTKPVLLMMTAWIDYADSTSNLAASQAGAKLIPPYLQVRDKNGKWQTVIQQMGFPAGLPKTMTVDLTGRYLSKDTKVRIVTSMQIYWDRILVDTFNEVPNNNITILEPVHADLRWRGFPREYSPDGRKPLIYDYRMIEPTAPWKAHLGNYTRFGDVRELLIETDDMYVITRSGDEIQIDFDAGKLPVMNKGWKRTWLVYADGFGKDMDINSARPYTIGELPFHGMKSYPYSASDRYPDSKRHGDYIERYNTRTVNESLEASWRGVR